jgi:hypothetical protein
MKTSEMKTPEIKTLTIGMTAATVSMLLLTLVATTADARSYAAYRPVYRNAVRQNAQYQNVLYQNAQYPRDNARLAPPTVTFPNQAPSNQAQFSGQVKSTFSTPTLQPVPARSVAPQSVGPACDAVPHIPPGVATFGPPLVNYRPIVPLVAMPRSYQVGRGILGQPKVYVPGQPIRNALRYLTP